MAELKLGLSTQKQVIKEINDSVKLSELNELTTTNITDNTGKSFLDAKLPADLQTKKHGLGIQVKANDNKVVGNLEVSKDDTESKVQLQVFDDTGANPKSVGIVKNATGTYAFGPETQGVSDNELVTYKKMTDDIKTAKEELTEQLDQIVSARFPKVLEKDIDYIISNSTDKQKGEYEVVFLNDQDGGIIAVNATGEVVMFQVNWDLANKQKPKLGKCYTDVEDIKFITFVTTMHKP